MSSFGFSSARLVRGSNPVGRGRPHTFIIVIAALIVSLAACDRGGLSTAEVTAAAKERVRQSLGLGVQNALFTDVFVGRPKDDDVVICGTVSGARPDGATLGPRRFVAATDPARWIHFETAAEAGQPDEIGRTSTDMFVDEWSRYCVGERGR